MDRLHLMSVFIAVVEEEGFSSAARKLNMSPPAVTRSISLLENNLGVKLLNRTTRFVRATEAGMRYFEDSKRILMDVAAADEAAAGINAEPQGHLAITAPVMFGQMFVMPGIVDYLSQYPKTEVEAVFLDRVVNLIEEGLDVAVRIGELPDSSMRALKVGQIRLILVASPSYLREKGIPKKLEDIHSHTLIAARSASNLYDWRFGSGYKASIKSESAKQTIKIKPRLTVTTNQAAINASKQGFGITRVLSYQVADALASGELKILLENYESAPLPIHIVHREGRLASTKVRAFIDLMAEKLRNDKRLI